MRKRQFLYVPQEELNEWKNLFNDHRNWGIRKDLIESENVSRDTLNRILLSGRAYDYTIKKIRKFVSSYNQPA